MKYLNPLILESKQVGIIYHFTGILNLKNMLNKNDFKLKSENNYISFTRNSNMFSSELAPSKLQTRIMIDGDKLSNKYKISPYRDFRGVKREHGEAEERFIKIDDIFMINPKTFVDIKDCIIEIDILDEPFFRYKEDEYFNHSAKFFNYGTDLNNSSYHINDPEPIINKHIEILKSIIDSLDNFRYNFDINIVSRFTNPKYQDKFIIYQI